MRRFFTWMLCAMVITSMTACLGNDDDNNNYQIKPLTPTEKAAQMLDMSGEYNGKLYFINDTTFVNDSVNISWSVNAFDSIMTIRNFPVRVLANGISEPITRTLLLSGGEFDMRAMLHPYANNFKTEGHYTFYMLPIDYTASFSIIDGEKTHSGTVTFTSQMTAYSSYAQESIFYATGEYYQRQFAGYLLIKSVSVDDLSYITGRTCMVYGKK